MCRFQFVAAMTVAVAGIGSPVHGAVEGETAAEGGGIVIRLVHPDRQAVAMLDLFHGARVAHPAAALVAWKRCTRDPDLLGKPLEAAIAMFNPEMAREWRVLHDAELRHRRRRE